MVLLRVVVVGCCLLGASKAQDAFLPEHLTRALELHRRALVIDTHSDVTPKFQETSWNFSERHADGHMDIPSMLEGGMDGQFFSIYMGETPGDGRAIKTALARIDAVHETVRRHQDVLEMAWSARDIHRIWKENKIACTMGIEGGHIIENSLPALRMFHRLGCRYMTLTHSFNTEWADSSGIEDDVAGQSGGLTARGEDIVREMNRLGMMVDISHVSDKTFRDALRVTTAPVIASHSSARALCDHRRNLTDEMLVAVRKNGGVVMVNFFSGFIDPAWDGALKEWEKEHQDALGKLAARFKANRGAFWNARNAFAREHPMRKIPLLSLALHVEHVAKVAGWDHVGIGADWDGVRALPDRMDHCGQLPNLTALLLARGHREPDLLKFLGMNITRVMAACEDEARRLAAEESTKPR